MVVFKKEEEVQSNELVCFSDDMICVNNNVFNPLDNTRIRGDSLQWYFSCIATNLSDLKERLWFDNSILNSRMHIIL